MNGKRKMYNVDVCLLLPDNPTRDFMIYSWISDLTASATARYIFDRDNYGFQEGHLKKWPSFTNLQEF